MSEIIFEDNHVLIAFKPSGIPTQKSDDHPSSLEEELKKYIKIRDQKSGNVFLHAVHRIDRVTSGLVVFAKTQKALARLQESLRENKWEKLYLAFIEGELNQQNGILEHNMIRDEQTLRIAKPHEKSLTCILSYNVLEKHQKSSLIDITLHTGRYHQIRAQFSAVHHPLVNDTKYGAKLLTNLSEIALLQYQISFPHPIKQERVSFRIDTYKDTFKKKWISHAGTIIEV